MNLSYLYIYGQELGNARFNKLLSRLESHVLELGIKGKIVRLSPLKNLGEVIADASAHGTQTIVAVGDDATLSQVVCASVGSRMVIGYIPTSAHSKIARILGIPPLEAAADVLSARIIKTIDLGKVGTAYFMDSLGIESPERASVHFARFATSFVPGSYASVCNIGFEVPGSNGKVFDPQDGLLNLVVSGTKKMPQATQLPLQSVMIKDDGDPINLVLDGNITVKTPAKIEVVPNCLKVIVGSDRLFN